jgi:hypothetical protein
MLLQPAHISLQHYALCLRHRDNMWLYYTKHIHEIVIFPLKWMFLHASWQRNTQYRRDKCGTDFFHFSFAPLLWATSRVIKFFYQWIAKKNKIKTKLYGPVHPPAHSRHSHVLFTLKMTDGSWLTSVQLMRMRTPTFNWRYLEIHHLPSSGGRSVLMFRPMVAGQLSCSA